MANLQSYLSDGANHQARAVLAYLPILCCEIKGVEIARWENCREQGYVVFVSTPDYKNQLNIAFFEHRNSDEICAVKWEQTSMNALTIATAKFGNVYKDKFDISYETGYGEVVEMAEWIANELKEFVGIID